MAWNDPNRRAFSRSTEDRFRSAGDVAAGEGGRLRGSKKELDGEQKNILDETLEMTPGQQVMTSLSQSPELPEGAEWERGEKPLPPIKEAYDNIPAQSGQARDRWEEEKMRLSIDRNYPGLHPDNAMAMVQEGMLPSPDVPEKFNQKNWPDYLEKLDEMEKASKTVADPSEVYKSGTSIPGYDVEGGVPQRFLQYMRPSDLQQLMGQFGGEQARQPFSTEAIRRGLLGDWDGGGGGGFLGFGGGGGAPEFVDMMRNAAVEQYAKDQGLQQMEGNDSFFGMGGSDSGASWEDVADLAPDQQEQYIEQALEREGQDRPLYPYTKHGEMSSPTLTPEAKRLAQVELSRRGLLPDDWNHSEIPMQQQALGSVRQTDVGSGDIMPSESMNQIPTPQLRMYALDNTNPILQEMAKKEQERRQAQETMSSALQGSIQDRW